MLVSAGQYLPAAVSRNPSGLVTIQRSVCQTVVFSHAVCSAHVHAYRELSSLETAAALSH